MSHDDRRHHVTRTVLRVAGPLLLLGGAASVAMGFTGTGLAADDPDEPSAVWTDEDGAVVDVPDEFVDEFAFDVELDEPHFGFIVGGGLASATGLFLTGLGWGGALTRYQVNEALPAMRDARRGLGLEQHPLPGSLGATPAPQPIGGAPFCRECGAQAKDTLQVFCGACGRTLE